MGLAEILERSAPLIELRLGDGLILLRELEIPLSDVMRGFEFADEVGLGAYLLFDLETPAADIEFGGVEIGLSFGDGGVGMRTVNGDLRLYPDVDVVALKLIEVLGLVVGS